MISEFPFQTVNNVSSAPIPIPTPKKPPSAAHIKSHSLGGNVESNASNTTESVSFSAVSELWHRRAASQVKYNFYLHF